MSFGVAALMVYFLVSLFIILALCRAAARGDEI